MTITSSVTLVTATISVPFLKKKAPMTAEVVKSTLYCYGKGFFSVKTGLPPIEAQHYFGCLDIMSTYNKYLLNKAIIKFKKTKINKKST